MIGPFEELLKDLGKELGLALKIDQKNACSIQIHAHLIIQLQLDTAQENLWIFSQLVDTPPGKFRENIFKETLKANYKKDPIIASFGYLSSTNQLAIFQKYPLSILDGKRLAGFLGAFLELGEVWREAILSGQSAPLSAQGTPKESNPFGLK